MMFEYNANLDFDDRLNMVYKEIKSSYPYIDKSTAIMSAVLSPSYDDKPTNDEKFERYYFLLKYCDKNNPDFLRIFNDLYELYDDGFKNEIFKACMEEIIKYVNNYRYTFPDLSEFYEA